jgi:hypothetical protein
MYFGPGLDHKNRRETFPIILAEEWVEEFEKQGLPVIIY